jgi:hypothetical protein
MREKNLLKIFLLSTFLVSGLLVAGVYSPVYASVTLESGETVILALGEEIAIAGGLTIASNSTLDTSAGAVDVTLSGSWINSGTYVPLTTNITFTGAGTSTIIGTNTFFNFTCTTPGKQIIFESGKEQAITGTLTLLGSVSNKILLRALTTGTRWGFKSENIVQQIDFIDVKDSNASGTIINSYHSTDSGNNAGNWRFVSLTIDDHVAGATVNMTPIILGTAGANATVSLKDKDSLKVATTTADSSGNYFALVSTPMATGANSLTAYIDTIQGQSIDLTVTDSLPGGQAPEILSLATGDTIKGNVPDISGRSTPGASVNLLKLSALVIQASGFLVSSFTDDQYKYDLIAATIADANGDFAFAAADYKDYLVPGINRFMVTANGARSPILEVKVATPLGIVFDAKNNNAISGASVSLYKSNGALAQPGVDIAATDANPQTTGTDGSYGFVCNSGDYYCMVGYSSYRYPTIQSSFDSSRNIIIGSKMDTFMVGNRIFQMDLPLDSSEAFYCYPNPFNPGQQILTIQYYMDNDAAVSVSIYNIAGELVRNWEMPAGGQYAQKGMNRISWDGRNDADVKAASGIYLVFVNCGGSKKTFKVALVK